MSDIDFMDYAENKEEAREPILQNDSILTEQAMKEALTAFLRTPSWIFVRVLFAVMAGVGVYMVIRGVSLGMDMTNILSGALVILFSAAMYLHRFLMYPSKKARDIMKARKQKYKTDDVRTEYRFYDESIVSLTNGEETAEITYDSIRRIYRTQNYIVLSTFSRKMLLLSPDGFDYGDEADFMMLIKLKCPKALPKEKH